MEGNQERERSYEFDQSRFMSTRLATLLRGYTALDDTQLQDATQPKDIAAGQCYSSHFLSTRSHSHLALLCIGLVRGEWKLIEIVKGLQDNLTSENDAVRSRGKFP